MFVTRSQGRVLVENGFFFPESFNTVSCFFLQASPNDMAVNLEGHLISPRDSCIFAYQLRCPLVIRSHSCKGTQAANRFNGFDLDFHNDIRG